MADLTPWIIAAPLVGFIVLFAGGRWLRGPAAGYFGSATVGVSFLLAAIASTDFLEGGSNTHPATVKLFEWIPSLGVDATLLWDPLSAVMTLVITGVGTLIHIYSIGYMQGDERFGRFFTYLNLFIVSMLLLVLGANFGVLFVGWELVGLSSYLLISFWFEKPTAAAAGKKAFVVNRIGDLGFLIALMLIFAEFGSLAFGSVFDAAPGVLEHGGARVTAITLLLLVGAAGKSAQIPLYVWLPDAMEGPTPVSALIHAATMVTAGVYMVARAGVLFELAPFSAGTVAVVGAATALYAATLAIGQRDIKRVLAYSTISQLGYMFLAVGVGAYVAGMFHLITHAFFKALLFLGAGSVIHALDGEQDMARMGGLRRAMPLTFVTMAVAWLAISGVPPLSGFWSKDEILAVTFEKGGLFVALWLVGIVTAALTALYMSRLMFMTFWGESRWPSGAVPYESPRLMTLPLLALGALAVVGGVLNTPMLPALEHFLEPAFGLVEQAHLPGAGVQWALAIVSVAAALAGIGYAARRYRGHDLPAEEGGIWTRLEHGYYIDDLYGKVLVGPGKAAARTAAFVFDTRIIDGAVNGVAALVRAAGQRMRFLQTGRVRNYGAGILAGAVGLVILVLIRGGGL